MLSNINDTQPGVPTLPPPFVNAFLMLDAARFLLSVKASTMIAVPLGPYPSYVTDSKSDISVLAAFLIALSIVSLGILAALHLVTTCLSLLLLLTSGPPSLTATIISLPSLVNILPLAASLAAFLWAMLANFECPDILFLLF